MPAGQDPAEAADQALAFAPLGARHLLPTRLDLARRLGSLVAAAAAADLMLTEAGIGAGATDGLAAITPAFLAERLGWAPEAAHTLLPWRPAKAAPLGARPGRPTPSNGYSV